VERTVHEKLKEFRFNEQREFFKLSVKEAIDAIVRVVEELEEAKVAAEQSEEILPDGLTRLMRAVLRKDDAFVASLLARGEDPNATTDDGVTALMLAATRGYSKIADLLLANGARLDLRARDGTNALSLAKEREHVTTLNVLNYYLRNSALESACAQRNYDAVVGLLEDGAVPGESALDMAARVGSARIVEVLLKHGAKSENAKSLAEANGHLVAAALIEKYIPSD
jgi:ankyrin repeat protein